ncbi:hypothetical protein [Deinococcus sp.]|uniref:hypothetical protein n=1 Tax=Deinococcus sp. TaxID=47478 RepID=UPI003C7CA31D
MLTITSGGAESRWREAIDIFKGQENYFYVQSENPMTLFGVKVLGEGFFLCQGVKMRIGVMDGILCGIYTPGDATGEA